MELVGYVFIFGNVDYTLWPVECFRPSAEQWVKSKSRLNLEMFMNNVMTQLPVGTGSVHFVADSKYYVL
jgi:hypothetical protein